MICPKVNFWRMIVEALVSWGIHIERGVCVNGGVLSALFPRVVQASFPDVGH